MRWQLARCQSAETWLRHDKRSQLGRAGLFGRVGILLSTSYARGGPNGGGPVRFSSGRVSIRSEAFAEQMRAAGVGRRDKGVVG